MGDGGLKNSIAGVDFAFVDAENLYRSLNDTLRRFGVDNTQERLVDIADLIGVGGVTSEGWPNHSRRLIYYAAKDDNIPFWLEKCKRSRGFIRRTGRLTTKGSSVK